MTPFPAATLPSTSLDTYFTGSVTIHSEYQVEVNGVILTPGAIQRLAGCPAGGHVFVSFSDTEDRICFHSKHPTLIDNRYKQNAVELRRDAQGYYLYADYIWYAAAAPNGPAPKGLGAVALLFMAYQAHLLNLPRIDLLAAGGSGVKGAGWTEQFWGYEVWPRLGFECELQPAILELISTIPHLAGCTRISQLVEIDLAWWKAQGDGWDMSFDLTSGSKSWDTLYRFCLSRGLLK